MLKGQALKPLLSTNFYSYTYPDYPVLNHHWLSGVVFYGVHRAAGFKGLALFHIFLYAAAFGLMFWVACRENSFNAAALLSLLLLPLLADREEIRPEAFSIFFTAAYFSLLYATAKGHLSKHWQWALPFFQVLWVNLHIYFVMGWVVTGSFWLAALQEPRNGRASDAKRMGILLIAVLAASCVHPSGFGAALFPFHIFKDYGVRVIENASVWTLEKMGRPFPSYTYYKIALILFLWAFGAFLVFLKKIPSLIFTLPGLCIAVLASLAIRNLTLFGFIMLPVLSYFLKSAAPFIPKYLKPSPRRTVLLSAFLLVFFVFMFRDYRAYYATNFGLGIRAGNEKPGQFLRKSGIRGPIFNNFDSGSYLIYYLFPKERVFLDTRPEAYPASFIKESCDKVLKSEESWRALDDKMHFETIFFSQDLRPAAKRFIIARMKDKAWKVAYADAQAVVLRRVNL